MRLLSALLLGAGTVAVMVVLAFSVSNDKLRIAFFLVACVLAAAVVFVLPPHWRRRLGPPTAVFIAAASALSVFLVNPQAGSSDPKIDTQEMANAILVGPFDQRLPQSVTAGDPEMWGTRDASAIANLAVVRIEMTSTKSGGQTGGNWGATSQIEIYPAPEDAAARGQVQYDWRSGREEAARKGQPEPEVGKNTPEMWCFINDGGPDSSSQWVCGGYRGHAYAQTYMPFGALTQITYTDAQMIQSAMLRYAEGKEKLATEPR